MRIPYALASIADRLACRDRFILFDLFCGAGGATRGYQEAGFTVVGVDKKPQPRYVGDLFIQADAREILQEDWFGLVRAVHASPPCKHYTRLRTLRDAQGLKPSDGDFLWETRELLDQWGGLYLIENVMRAPMRHDAILCGTQFDLSWGGRQLQRHRIFEANFKISRKGCRHRGTPWGVYGRLNHEIPNGGATPPTLDAARSLMGISWMNWRELKEAIPPAYTQHLGTQLAAQLELDDREAAECHSTGTRPMSLAM